MTNDINMKNRPAIQLKHSNMELELTPGIGGSVARYGYWQKSDNGKQEFINILRPAPENIDPENPLAAGDTGLHVGVPYINRIEPCNFKGRKLGQKANNPLVEHRIHGDGYQQAWDVEHQGSNFAVMSYEHKGEHGFPFRYKATQTFRLTDKGLSVDVKVQNLEKERTIPAGIGLHYYWAKTPKAKLTANNTELQFNVATDTPESTSRPTPDKMDCSKGRDVNDIYGLDANFKTPDGSFTIEYPELNKKIEHSSSGNFKNNYLTVCIPDWTQALCIEPMTHEVYGTSNLAKGRRTPEQTGLAMLKPGEKLNLKSVIAIKDIENSKTKPLTAAMLKDQKSR